MKELIKKIIGKKGSEKAAILLIMTQQILSDLENVKKYKTIKRKTKSASLLKLKDRKRQTFFGYYDITPFSKDDTKVLAISTESSKSPIFNSNLKATLKKAAYIGYFDLRNPGQFHQIGESKTWCWQQGCRLQWLPENEDELIIYNLIVDGAIGSVIQNIKTKKIVNKFEHPVYAIDRSGKWAITLNFLRLDRLRPGYGYTNFKDHSARDLCPKFDGIKRMNLDTGEADLIVTLECLKKFNTQASMANAEHYINHLCFNCSGEKFILFHLWVKNNTTYNRIVLCNLDGEVLQVLEDERNFSHYAWKSDDELLATQIVGKDAARYTLYDFSKNSSVGIGNMILNRDGHPSYSPGGDVILIDTYPDNKGRQSLLLYSKNNQLEVLDRFRHPMLPLLRFSEEVRCDLHPRWDRSGQRVCFDSTHEGDRAMYIYSLEPTVA